MFEAGDLLDVLSRLSTELQRERDLEMALTRITDALGELLGCSDMGIWLADETLREFELKITNTSASHLSRIRVPFGMGMIGEVAESGRPMVVANALWGPGDDVFSNAGFCSAVAVPLIWRNEMYGVVVALDDIPGHPFTPRDVRLMTIFAQQITLIVGDERMRNRTRQLEQALLNEQERLLHVHAAIRRMLDQPDTQAHLTEVTEALHTLGWRRVLLGLFAAGSSDCFITGFPGEENQSGDISAVIPPDVWQLFSDGNLEAYRLNGLYYVPCNEAGTAWNSGDVLFAPLRVGQGPVAGVIRVDDPVEPVRPSVESLRSVDILTSQVAYIFENARLIDAMTRSAAELADQVDELSMIHRADRELSSHLNMNRVMTLAMDWALRRTNADTGLLTLMTSDKRGLVPFITMGYLDRRILECTEQEPWPLDRGVMGLAATSGTIQIVRGAEALSDELMPGSSAQIAIPLAMRGEVLGVLMLGTNDEDAFQEHDTSFLERLARRAAVALDNARLFRQSEQLADDMAVLYSASSTITSTLERDEVLQRIAQSMAVALECSSAIIYNYLPKTYELQVQAVYKVGTIRDVQEILPEVRAVFSLNSLPAFHEVVEQQHPLALRASALTISELDREIMASQKIQAMVLAPLIAQGELIGLAMVIEGRQDRIFTSDELFKAETLAGQASVALRQSMLYNEVLELERVKSEMIRMASHDLRNPLNNIIGYIELVAMSIDQIGMTPDLQEYLGSLRRSTKTIRSLIDDLLTLERVESERESAWEHFDFDGLVYEVVDIEQSGAALKNQTLELERAPSEITVFGSVTQLRQAITNLIGNAIKYTPDSGRVDVRLTQEDDRLVFTVKDTGYGISRDRQDRLFERFYRAHQPGTDHIPGTGLGLSLVKTVIERHGGRVWFESEPGQGSLFGFWLPVAKP
jgi:signal transduction histidine kinase